jgi:hypothetical protein
MDRLLAEHIAEFSRNYLSTPEDRAEARACIMGAVITGAILFVVGFLLWAVGT